MIRHGYHSYRGPAYRGTNLDATGYGVGVELETDVERRIFDYAQTVRGVRPERDGSLDHTTGVEFIFAASDDLRTIARRFTAVKERTRFGTGGYREYYGCHININAQTKSATWRKLMALSASIQSNNVPFLKQVGRRAGYSGFASSGSFWGVTQWTTGTITQLNISGSTPGQNGQKYAVALRPNRVEFRIFKTCDKLETLVLYILFSQYWSKWISAVEAALPSAATVAEALDALQHSNFSLWLSTLASTSREAAAVLKLVTVCADRRIVPGYFDEEAYVNSAGEEINAICRDLLARQRRSIGTSTVVAVVPTSSGEPSPATA